MCRQQPKHLQCAHKFFRANGNSFAVPRENVLIPTPKTGQVVTFSFEKQSIETNLRGPKISRVRTDLSWADVVRSYGSENQKVLCMRLMRRCCMRVLRGRKWACWVIPVCCVPGSRACCVSTCVGWLFVCMSISDCLSPSSDGSINFEHSPERANFLQ